jgi:hypothetical protein
MPRPMRQERGMHLAQHVDHGIDREDRYRRVTGNRENNQPRGVVAGSRRLPIGAPGGCGIIALHRTSGARLHRPWRPDIVADLLHSPSPSFRPKSHSMPPSSRMTPAMCRPTRRSRTGCYGTRLLLLSSAFNIKKRNWCSYGLSRPRRLLVAATATAVSPLPKSNRIGWQRSHTNLHVSR